ncbi:glycosyltransferase [[Haemophilus] felis]|uniref:Glycosyltransferase n=1 Tax=[Haemophilus] felis TaxID=123822 RepID=A0A1T0AY14_9PAST|nr:glycosyltransferase [[Haemophilus] felis]NBI41635.1 glycosyltransferase [[Haemophilus] felis]OOS02843.1 glycosyltransferase [[Haemophilus] felis]
MKKNPLVSVLICAYNVEKYIDECLNAIVNQSYKNLEIIIVNDGSIDSTLSRIKYYANKDNRIKIIDNKTNFGFIDSLNLGIEHVKGDFLARTDADDVVKLDWIEKIITYLLSHSEVVAMGSYLTVLSEEGNGSKLVNYYENGQEWKNPLQHNEIVEAMLFRNPIHNNSMIMRTSVLKEFNLKFDRSYKYAEDYKFWLDVSRVGKMANYPETLVYYRFHSNQTSSRYNQEQNLAAQKIRKIAINYHFDDLGIKNRIGEEILFGDVVKIQEELVNLSLLNKAYIQTIIYELYLSLRVNKFCYIWYFLKNKNNNFLSKKQKLKVIKRMIRPWKYKEIL